MIDPPVDEVTGQEDAPSKKDEQRRDWTQAVAQAAQIAALAGQLPGSLKSLVKELVESHTPWQALLREFMTVHCKDDYSWRRPNRRYIHAGMYLPAAYSERVGRVVVVADTSGSIRDWLLERFVSEVNVILEDIKPESVTFIQADARVCDVREYRPEDLPMEVPEMLGRGGTAFQPTFDWVEQEADEPPVVLVYLTDMAPCDSPRDPGYPVIWVDYARGTWSRDWCTFGQIVVIDD